MNKKSTLEIVQKCGECNGCDGATSYATDHKFSCPHCDRGYVPRMKECPDDDSSCRWCSAENCVDGLIPIGTTEEIKQAIGVLNDT